jgi:hypothetical protein
VENTLCVFAVDSSGNIADPPSRTKSSIVNNPKSTSMMSEVVITDGNDDEKNGVMSDVSKEAAMASTPLPAGGGGDDYVGDDEEMCLDDQFHDETLDDADDNDDDAVHRNPPPSEQAAPSNKNGMAETISDGDGGEGTAIHPRSSRRSRSWTVVTALMVLVVVVVIAVVLGVTLSSSSNPSSGGSDNEKSDVESPVAGPPSPTPVFDDEGPAPLPPPSSDPPSADPREVYLTALAETWSGSTALGDTRSAASRALHWLVHKDPMRLSAENAVLDVQQRYTAAVLYHATDGHAWGRRGDDADDAGRTRRTTRRSRRMRRGRKTSMPRRRRASSWTSSQSLMISSGTARTRTTTTGTSITGDRDRALQDGNNNSAAIANYLSGLDVCFWTTPSEERGLICDDAGLVRELQFGML